MTSNHAPAPLAATIAGRANNGPDDDTTLVFTWVPEDPHLVSVVIQYLAEEPEEWLIGRDLLIDYYGRGEAGDCDAGDIRIYTDDGDPAKQDVSTIHLSNDNGEAFIEVPQPTLRAFARLMKDVAKRYEAEEAALVLAELDAYLAAECGAA